MKTTPFLSVAVLALSLCCASAFAQDTENPYEQYYQNLPIELAKVQPVTFPEAKTNIAKYGARPNQDTLLCTEAIQTAIDELAAQGGGHVIVPRGTWKTGPIELRSNIDLHLNKGAVLLFTEDKTQYILPDKKGKVPSKARPCVSASKCENVGITGQGVLDGQGFYWRPIKYKKIMKGDADDKAMWDVAKSLGGKLVPNGKDTLWYPWHINTTTGQPIATIGSSYDEQEKMRYHLVNITDSKNVLIQGVTLRNSPKFHLVPARIQNLIIDNVTIWCPWWAQNGDAMDIGNSQTVLVVNTKLNCGDDGICMKGGVGEDGVKRGPNSDFLIINDTVYRAHGGFVIGSEFSGGMQRLVVKNCYFDGTDIGLRFKSAPGRGGWCKDIYCEDIVMRNILEDVVFFESGYADRAVGRSATDSDNKEAFFPDWGNITIRRVTAANVRSFVNATGLKGFPVHDIKLDDVHIYGVQKTPLMMKFCEKWFFTNCTYSGGSANEVEAKSCKKIVLNGKDLAEE